MYKRQEEGRERARYLEVYKLRNTAHLHGRHNIAIGADGLSIFPRYADESRLEGANKLKAQGAVAQNRHRRQTRRPGP